MWETFYINVSKRNIPGSAALEVNALCHGKLHINSVGGFWNASASQSALIPITLPL